MPPLFFYQLALLGLLWLCVMLHLAWPSRGPVSSRRSVEPETSVKSGRKRSNAPPLFVGLTHKPSCALCEHEASHPTPPPPLRPDPMSPPNRRPRQVDTSRHFCPHEGCDYRGWLGLGNLRANRHPNGGSCPSSLRILPPLPKPGTMLPYHTLMRERCRDAAPCVLPTRDFGRPMALRYVA